MKRKELFTFVVFCLSVFLILVSGICSAVNYEILDTGIAISTTPRHEWNPWVEYNAVDDEFLIIWNTSGILRDDCTAGDDYECTKSFQSIEATRISPDGNILEKPIISPAKGPLENVSWIAMPRISYNRFRNEYMGIFHMSGDTCVQCHDRNPQTGQPEPADISKCIICHPGDNPGLCNLAKFHDPGKGASCLTCHADCTGGSPPAPPTPHPDNCIGCHKVNDIHYQIGHTSYGNELYEMRIDNNGIVMTEPERLYKTPSSAGHPIMTFNSVRKQYLIANNDTFFTKQYDNVGFIVDEDGKVIRGPLQIGEGEWSHFLYYVVHNPIDDTYFIPFEDFRHASGAWYFGPNDIYAALLDGEGNTLADFPVIEDTAEGEYEQWYPCVAHNPDRNEFFVVWFDERPIFKDGGIVGRIFNSDGTPKGEPFVVVDESGSQGDMALVYVQKEKRYFMVWQDSRNYVPKPDDPPSKRENDIYGSWLDENGLPVGNEIVIYEGEGDQSMPQMAYSPVTDRFLITWWDLNAPEDYKPVPGEFGAFEEINSVPMGIIVAGNVGGAIYGIQSFLTVRVVDQDTGTPVEDARVIVFGLGLLKMETTSIGGWCNLPKDSQRNGSYFILVQKERYRVAFKNELYSGIPLKTLIEIKKR
jgi:hypothetical protein